MKNPLSTKGAAPALGVFMWFGFRVPFADRVRMIRDAGFETTCVWWEERNVARRRLRHLIPDVIRREGLRLENIHVPYDGCAALWSAEDADRNAATAQHIAWVGDCARHEIPAMVMHVAQGRATPPPGEHGIESMRRIVEAAEDVGVTVAIENTRSPAHVLHLLERIDSPRLGLCYDVSHDWLYSGEPFALLNRWKHRLVCAHVGDTDGKRDRHWLPGDGVVDFGAFTAALSGAAACGSLLLEPAPKDKSETAEAFLRRAFRAISSIQSAVPVSGAAAEG